MTSEPESREKKTGDGNELPIVRQSFSPEDLSFFAQEHISYEIGMLVNDVYTWAHSPGILAVPIQFALMESALVHLRLLDDFLTLPSRLTNEADARGGGRQLVELDDVLATDYLDEWQPSSKRLLGESRQGINSHVAHLSMSRQSQRAWDLLTLTDTVAREFLRFIGSLAAEQSLFALSFEPGKSSAESFVRWFADLGTTTKTEATTDPTSSSPTTETDASVQSPQAGLPPWLTWPPTAPSTTTYSEVRFSTGHRSDE